MKGIRTFQLLNTPLWHFGYFKLKMVKEQQMQEWSSDFTFLPKERRQIFQENGTFPVPERGGYSCYQRWKINTKMNVCKQNLLKKPYLPFVCPIDFLVTFSQFTTILYPMSFFLCLVISPKFTIFLLKWYRSS